MRVKASSLRRIIQEELRRSLKERTFPDTLEIDPSGETFSIEAEPDREGETGERKRIRGRIETHRKKGEEPRRLPKANREDIEAGKYFNPKYSAREVSGQLSAQTRGLINQMMDDLGFEAAVIDTALRGGTKGDVMGDALVQLLSLSDKLRSKKDRDILKAAVESILGIKMGFSVPDPFEIEEEL